MGEIPRGWMGLVGELGRNLERSVNGAVLRRKGELGGCVV